MEDAARAANKEPAELLEEAVKHYLDDCSWAKLMRYGQDQAKAVGVRTEDDVDRLIAESRREHFGR